MAKMHVSANSMITNVWNQVRNKNLPNTIVSKNDTTGCDKKSQNSVHLRSIENHTQKITRG